MYCAVSSWLDFQGNRAPKISQLQSIKAHPKPLKQPNTSMQSHKLDQAPLVVMMSSTLNRHFTESKIMLEMSRKYRPVPLPYDHDGTLTEVETAQHGVDVAPVTKPNLFQALVLRNSRVLFDGAFPADGMSVHTCPRRRRRASWISPVGSLVGMTRAAARGSPSSGLPSPGCPRSLASRCSRARPSVMGGPWLGVVTLVRV